jgi:uncharacterized RDD family membrane protein YckC
MSENRIGVLYRKNDYPGFFTRLLIDVVDISAIILFSAISFLTLFANVENDLTIGRLLFAYFLMGFGYLGPWKATRFPTLGYLVFRVKIVNAMGERINVWQATGRAILMFVGPVNYLFDLIWLYGETPRQALRDKLAGTYLIKKNAQVESSGKIVGKILHVMGYRMRVEEIQKLDPRG